MGTISDEYKQDIEEIFGNIYREWIEKNIGKKIKQIFDEKSKELLENIEPNFNSLKKDINQTSLELFQKNESKIENILKTNQKSIIDIINNNNENNIKRINSLDNKISTAIDKTDKLLDMFNDFKIQTNNFENETQKNYEKLMQKMIKNNDLVSQNLEDSEESIQQVLTKTNENFLFIKELIKKTEDNNEAKLNKLENEIYTYLNDKVKKIKKSQKLEIFLLGGNLAIIILVLSLLIKLIFF